MKKILTIIGSTGLGKTDLAIKIAKKINGEIIGLDSIRIRMLKIMRSHHLVGDGLRME